tara:strand:- start:25 stop:1275 length:1251 start_codon:yes stop_codon:yes gene_type:complete
MRNIFDQYNQPENKLTHSLVSCLYEDKQLLNSFLKSFCSDFFKKSSNLQIEQQTVPGELNLLDDENDRKGLPDAVIYTEEQCLIIESKVSSTLTKDQLIRHEKTVRRRGFNNVRGIGIVVDLLPNIRLDNWKQLTWNQIYNWVYNETENSKWAKKLLDYFNIAENKMVENEYLTEGSITEFTGINFNQNNPYSYLEGKRTLKLLIKKIKQNKILEKELNADLNGKGRGGIKKGNLWDFITFKKNEKKKFTHQPHLTIGLNETHVSGNLTVPHGVKGKVKKNFQKISWKEFNEIIYKVAINYDKYFGKSEGFKPNIITVQRRYPSQSSPPIHDGTITFDIRTSFNDLSSKLKPKQKTQKEWLRAVFDVIKNKKSNIQFQVGAHFYYNKNTLVNNKDADQVIIKSFLACKPLIQHLFR